MPLGLDLSLLSAALGAMMTRINALQPEPELLISPLIQMPIVSVEEKIVEILAYLEKNETATLFTLLKVARDKADLLARFMGVLELIKIRRVLICKSIFDAAPLSAPDEPEQIDVGLADQSNATAGLTLTLTLNPDFDPTESDFASEFESDAPEVIPTQDEEEAEKNGTN